jgi:ABC-type Mn2+/Zn2+ transport system permease subunit
MTGGAGTEFIVIHVRHRVASARRRWTILCFILISILAGFLPRPLRAAPADATDKDTQQSLKDLDAIETPKVTSTLNDSDADRGIRWGRLIHMFDYMLATAAALGVSASVLGLFVVLRREALVAFAIPEVVSVGAAIGMRLGWPTLPPALGVALVALVYFALSKRWAASNWIVPSAYIAGLCISFLIIANHGQDAEDLKRLFVGMDVAVGAEQARVAVPILLVVGGICAALWRRWLLFAQAPAAAELAGLRPSRWDTLFLALLTVVILLGTNALGVVMVLAMLFLPAATILPWAKRLPAAMIAAAALSLVYLAIGFYLSNRMDWPLSQSIGGTGFAALVLSHIGAKFR